MGASSSIPKVNTMFQCNQVKQKDTDQLKQKDTDQPKPVDRQLDIIYPKNSVGMSTTNFSHKMIQHMGTKCPILSVFSLYGLLYHLSRGIYGPDQQKLRKIIGLNDTEDINDLSNFNNTYRSLTKGDMVLIYNFIVVANGIKLKDEYVNSTKSTFDIFGGKKMEDNFKDTMMERVNKLIEIKTNGRIKNFLTPNHNNSIIILGSVVHFSLLWKNPFKVSNTIPRRFIHNNESSLIPMMKEKIKLVPYYANDTSQFKYIELEYMNSNMVMGFMLPNFPPVDNDISTYDNKFFTSENITTSMVNTKRTTVEVYIPKFEIRKKMSLNNIIMGIGGEFLFKNINLSNMIHPSQKDISKMGCVTDIMQEVIFDVSETKTEFTSATTVTLKTMSMRTDSYPIFCADHRFFYHIYDKTTMVPIVSGIFDKN